MHVETLKNALKCLAIHVTILRRLFYKFSAN